MQNELGKECFERDKGAQADRLKQKMFWSNI